MAVEENIMICIDNSQSMMSLDTRYMYTLQLNCVRSYCRAKLKSNPKNAIGILPMGIMKSGYELQPTSDLNRILYHLESFRQHDGELLFSLAFHFSKRILELTYPEHPKRMLFFFWRGKIHSSLSHGYLRSCPVSLGAGRSRGSRDTRVRIRVETRWRGEEAVDIDDYRLWFSGSRVARNGVGIFIGPLYKDNIVGVDRCSDRIMAVRLVIQEETYMVICAYAPHAGLGDEEKSRFWESLDEVVRRTFSDGYTGVHGGFGYGVRNEEGRSILEFAVAHDLVVANSFFRETEAQLATFHSGGHSTQIDYLLLRKGDLKACRDCRALTTWTCSTQHRLLVMDLVVQRRVTRRVRPVQPRILWKKLNEVNAETFKASVLERVEAGMDTVTQVDADQMWNSLATTIRDVAKETLGVAVGTSRGHKSSRESWWISDEVQTKVALKQLRFRELIRCRDGTRDDRTRAEERYKEANREAKKAVARAKDKAYEDLYRKLDSKEGANDIYRIAKARERRRRDIDITKFIKDEAGQTIVKEEEIRKRWEGYFSSLFVGEGLGRQEDPQDLGIGQFRNNNFCRRISQGEVRSALRKMGRNKAVGPDQIPI
ncbi:uncharacterized protein [Rutidosis leptorrhynchoides]|uniref:uncharacterized protein n=1 Tax=Rutidosis leptorrhynchoides TaxID=125765 RepID=UPI003A98D073